jgi:hypothetical protein
VRDCVVAVGGGVGKGGLNVTLPEIKRLGSPNPIVVHDFYCPLCLLLF